MNYADTEKMRFVLLSQGFHEVEQSSDADVIILNTCSVRQRAEDKVLGLARRLKKQKLEHPGLKVFLTGCMASRVRREDNCVQNSSYRSELLQKMSWIDGIFEIGDISELCKLLRIEASTKDRGFVQQAYSSDISAFVPISQGCDNFCSYCIVPYSRGKEVHRERNEIVRKVEDLMKSGYRMITLLGQNVNSWKGTIDGNHADFSDLLKEIDDIAGNYWLSFLTSHPKDLSEKLVQTLACGTHFCSYFNLPVQSGSDNVQKKMNRRYSVKEYVEKVNLVRKYMPHIRMSTDVIVGFPGESTKDFKRTVDLVSHLRFGMVYVSEYSARAYTRSAKMPDTVPVKEKEMRKRQLEDIQRKIMSEENKKLVGTSVEVLVTGEGKGLAKDLREVRFPSKYSPKPGKLANAVVTAATAAGLQIVFDV